VSYQGNQDVLKNILLAVAAVLVIGLGILSFTQFSAAQELDKKLGMANLKLQCLQWRDEYILGIMEKDDGVETMDLCQNQFSDEQKKLIPAS
jgi:hypothetical protein